MTKIILLRGLSTSGGDNLGVGRVHLGPMMKHTARLLRNLGFDPYVLNGMGSGSLVEHVENAVQILSKLPFVREGEPLHLIGHSMGGLIARSLAQNLSFNIVAITTLATPHLGAHLAEVALNLRETHPRLYKLWKAIGYDVESRRNVFTDLTPTSVQSWKSKIVDSPKIDGASFQFSVPRSRLSPPLRILYGRFPSSFQPEEFDGYVELFSQFWGKSLGHFALDHLASNGWNFQMWPTRRREVEAEYARFGQALAERIRAIKF